MSCHYPKDCDCHQNSSFIFGLVFGLIIGAIIAVLIYKNNKGKVFEDLKKKLNEFISSLKKSETFENVSKIIDKVDINNSAKISKKSLKKHSKKVVAPAPKKSVPLKKEVILPQKLIAQSSETKTSVSKSKPRVFKK
ncbi:MAG: YtxH domain-containing protein [Candidatus Shapirobacteria bacterium]|jgi:gas vesicle protein